MFKIINALDLSNVLKREIGVSLRNTCRYSWNVDSGINSRPYLTPNEVNILRGIARGKIPVNKYHCSQL